MDGLNKKNLTKQIVIVAKMLENIANQYVLEPNGLSMGSFGIMHAIHEHKTLTPTLIMNCNGGTKSNVSQRLNFLEKNKYIKRIYAKNKNDKREILVQLTSLGEKKFLETSKSLHDKSILLENLLDKSEVEKHSLFLDKIINLLIKHEELLKKNS